MTLSREPGLQKSIFSFFTRQVPQLEDERRRFTLSAPEIARINPNTKTAPVFRTSADAQLTAAIYARMPVLIEDGKEAAGNPWRLDFRQGLFNMTSDSALFRTAAQLRANGWTRAGSDWIRGGVQPRQAAMAQIGDGGARYLDLSTGSNPSERYVPLYEAKMIHQFDHRWATYDDLESRDVTAVEKADPEFEPDARYWVPWHEVSSRLMAKGWTRGWLLSWRDITNATNERTVIAAAYPRSAVGHTLPLFFLDASPGSWAALLANVAALTLDFVARQKVGGTHLTYGYLNQFPILPPVAYTETDLAFIVPRVLELSYTSHAMAPFARDLGYDGAPFGWDEDRRAQLSAELDGWYALAYGLTRDELRYVLDPKDVMGADYPSETFRVLQKNEQAKYGEYRTRRLVLAAYDRLAASMPDTSTVADGDWRYDVSNEATVRLLLAGVVRRMREPRPIREVVRAFQYSARPHLLMRHLSADKQAEWRRLVGTDADPPISTTVTSMVPARLGLFAEAQANLSVRGQLRYDAAAGTWDRGAAIYEITLPPAVEGRADFVWQAMRGISFETTIAAMPQEEQDFHVRAAAA
jgi:hypothetical protein